MPPQQPRLDFHYPAVAHRIAEQRVPYQRVQPALKSPDNRASPVRRQRHRAGTMNEIPFLQFPIVEQRKRRRIGYDGPEFLGQVQRQRRPPVLGLVVKPQIGSNPTASADTAVCRASIE